MSKEWPLNGRTLYIGCCFACIGLVATITVILMGIAWLFRHIHFV